MMYKMKQVKILAAVAVALLCANVFVWFVLDVQTATEEEVVGITVTDVAITDLAAVLIINDQMSLGVIQQNGTLEVLTDDTGDFDATELLAMLYMMCNMSADKACTDSESFAQYGLDSPTAEVTLILIDGTEFTYQLLNPNSITGGYYLYDVQTETVYLVGENVGSMLGSGYSYYYSKTVFPVVTTSNYLTIEEISLDYGDDDSRDYTITVKNGTFYLTAPIEHQLSAVQVLSQLTSYISALYAEEVVATETDLSAYGFDSPDLVVTMTMAGVTYEGALISQDDGSILMADLTTNSVYLVEDGNYAMIASDYINLLAEKCFSIATGDLSRLQFTTQSQSVTMDVKGLDTSVELTVGGVTLEQEAVVEVVDAINSVTLANQVATPSTASATLTMTATYSSGTQSIYTFTANQTGGYDVSINGVTNFATTDTSVEDLLNLVSLYGKGL